MNIYSMAPPMFPVPMVVVKGAQSALLLQGGKEWDMRSRNRERMASSRAGTAGKKNHVITTQGALRHGAESETDLAWATAAVCESWDTILLVCDAGQIGRFEQMLEDIAFEMKLWDNFELFAGMAVVLAGNTVIFTMAATVDWEEIKRAILKPRQSEQTERLRQHYGDKWKDWGGRDFKRWR